MEQYSFPTGSEACLIGELIGLARATEGSEYRITPEITEILTAALSARGDGRLMDALREKVIAARRQIVPNCFICANPCGRTLPFDLTRLMEESEEIRKKSCCFWRRQRIWPGMDHIHR